MDVPWRAHGKQGTNLVWIGLNSSPGYQESEELTRGDTKDALGRIKYHPVIPQDAKCFFQMGDVICSLDALDEHIIFVYFCSCLDQLSKHLVH